MADDQKTQDALSDLFATARSNPPEPSEEFLARLRADADREAVGIQAPKPDSVPSRGLWDWVSALFPVSGLAATALAGVWIGFSLPDSDFAALYLEEAASDELDLSMFLPGAQFGALAETGAEE